MTISQAGINLIKSFESCKLLAYPDPAWGWKVPTIGWGHTGTLDCEMGVAPGQGHPIKLGDIITQPQADALLYQDLQHFSELVSSVLNCAVPPFSQNRFDALVSFAFNCIGWQGSTLFALVKQGSFTLASQEFPKWCHSGRPPVVIPGLVRRRAAEQKLFMGGA